MSSYGTLSPTGLVARHRVSTSSTPQANVTISRPRRSRPNRLARSAWQRLVILLAVVVVTSTIAIATRANASVGEPAIHQNGQSVSEPAGVLWV